MLLGCGQIIVNTIGEKKTPPIHLIAKYSIRIFLDINVKLSPFYILQFADIN
jgi:hypothetical protein